MKSSGRACVLVTEGLERISRRCYTHVRAHRVSGATTYTTMSSPPATGGYHEGTKNGSFLYFPVNMVIWEAV